MMNIGSPDHAFAYSMIPNDGVGLAREEFIIDSHIKIHPMALLHFDKVTDKAARKQIEELTAGYTNKAQYFIDKLAEGISIIGAAFYPNDVIIRFSDFKSNEYANLIGGAVFEPQENNPMIGWRGASRYYSEAYREAFELECLALRKVRDDMGITNIKAMIPFCRNLDEARKVIAIMEHCGLKQGQNGFEVYVMCEIPANVILAEQFADIFDGFSIGSNDLTQLALGVDRDNHTVAHVYDENNEAVKELIRHVINVAKKKKVKIGICGQAPSDYPQFARFLVEEGIDSISLAPDTIVKTTIDIKKTEEKLGR
jgi:pyruvate,water dikinase